MPANIFRTKQRAEDYAQSKGFTVRRAPECDADGPEYQFDDEQFNDKGQIMKQLSGLQGFKERRIMVETMHRYRQFMQLDATAGEIIRWLDEHHSQPIDRRGCSKKMLAESWATQARYPADVPFESLKRQFGLKGDKS